MNKTAQATHIKSRQKSIAVWIVLLVLPLLLVVLQLTLQLVYVSTRDLNQTNPQSVCLAAATDSNTNSAGDEISESTCSDLFKPSAAVSVATWALSGLIIASILLEPLWVYKLYKTVQRSSSSRKA